MNPEQATTIGAQLRTRREALGYSTRDVARHAHVNVAQIVRLEHGTVAYPKPEVLAAIAELLDLELGSLMLQADYPLPSMASYLASQYGHLPEQAREDILRITLLAEATIAAMERGQR